MKPPSPVSLTLALLGIAAAAFSFTHRPPPAGSRARTREPATYLREQGVTSWQHVGTYELRSFDAGQNWYAIECPPAHPPGDGNLPPPVNILGRAEDVYPGLRKHLAGMNALVAAAQNHRPLNPAVPADAELLRAAGFEPVSATGQKR